MRTITQLTAHQRLAECKHGTFLYNCHDQYVGMAIEHYGEYAEFELNLFKGLLGETDDVIEVGANIGAHSVPLAKFVHRGTLHVFEPQPVIFQNLCANLSLNGLENVLAWPLAVGDKPGRLVIPGIDYATTGNFGGVSLAEEGDGFNVSVITLDKYGADLDVQLIKADVEGMEKHVLEGAAELIERCQPYLYLENDRIEKSQELIEACWKLGYRLYWHTPPLFNPNNWNGNTDNIYKGIAAFNMIGIPISKNIVFGDAPEITDATSHPLGKP